MSKVCACREGCRGRGVLHDERSWAASGLRRRRVLRPEVSLRLLLGPPRWLEAIKQGGEFLEDYVIWPACSPTCAPLPSRRHWCSEAQPPRGHGTGRAVGPHVSFVDII